MTMGFFSEAEASCFYGKRKKIVTLTVLWENCNAGRNDMMGGALPGNVLVMLNCHAQSFLTHVLFSFDKPVAVISVIAHLNESFIAQPGIVMRFLQKPKHYAE